jgi:hypothetical protein
MCVKISSPPEGFNPAFGMTPQGRAGILRGDLLTISIAYPLISVKEKGA